MVEIVSRCGCTSMPWRQAGERSVVATFDRLLDLMESEGVPLGMPHDRIINRRERLWELRFGDHRCAYAEVDGLVVLLHAWRKRTQKLGSKGGSHRHQAAVVAQIAIRVPRTPARES